MGNLLKSKGRRFSATIQNIPVTGRIQVEYGKVYLCQNKKLGGTPVDTLGYKYGWLVWNGDESSRIGEEVHNFKLLDTTLDDLQAGDKISILRKDPYLVEGRLGNIVFLSYNNASCAVTYTIQSLKDSGATIVEDQQVEEEKVEMTVGEIAKKLGISPDKLLIKD